MLWGLGFWGAGVKLFVWGGWGSVDPKHLKSLCWGSPEVAEFLPILYLLHSRSGVRRTYPESLKDCGVLRVQGSKSTLLRLCELPFSVLGNFRQWAGGYVIRARAYSVTCGTQVVLGIGVGIVEFWVCRR